MSDWMKKIKEDVDNEMAERIEKERESIELDNRNKRAISELYEYILRKISQEDMHTFNREVLSEPGVKLKVQYPGFVSNEGKFLLTLSLYGYEVIKISDERRINAVCRKHIGEGRYEKVKDGQYDMSLIFENDKIINTNDGRKSIVESYDNVIQQLFTNLYTAYRHHE